MDKDNIMVIEYTESYGSQDFEMVAIYNKTRMSEERVKETIQYGYENTYVIKVSKSQYESVFGKLN